MLASLPVSTGIISSFFSHFIFSTSYSTAGSLLVKKDRPPPKPEGTRNSYYFAGQEAPAEALPKFLFSLRKRHQKENFVNFPTQYHILCLSKSHKNRNAIQKEIFQLPPWHCKPLRSIQTCLLNICSDIYYSHTTTSTETRQLLI